MVYTMNHLSSQPLAALRLSSIEHDGVLYENAMDLSLGRSQDAMRPRTSNTQHGLVMKSKKNGL